MLHTPSAPFEPVFINGDSVTLETEGKVLAMFTGDSNVLPGYNEYTIDRVPYTAGTHTFTYDTDENTGLLNLIYPFISIFDPASNTADFLLATDRFNSLSIIVNSSNVITSLTIGVRNGLIYHGQIVYPDFTKDSNSNGIPDFLETSVQGSLTKFLQSYDFPTVLIKTSDDLIITFSDDKTWEAAR